MDGLIEVKDLEKIDFLKWVDVFNCNFELWIFFVIDLFNFDNSLNEVMCKLLLELLIFVCCVSMQILSGDGEIVDLVEINEFIMKGFKGLV